MLKTLSNLLFYTFITVLVSVCLYPFTWMVFASFKQNTELFNPNNFWPKEWSFFAWELLRDGEFLNWKTGLMNSLLISFGQTFFAALFGFGFAFYLYFIKGKLKLILTILAVAAVVIPAQVMAIPLVEVSRDLGLYDNKWSIILTGSASGLGVLYFIQAFKRIPKALLDAAAIDGADQRSLFWLFFLESKSHLFGFLLLFFILCWHAHLLPLLLLHTEGNLPLPLSMRSLLDSSLRFPRAVLMAASCLLMIPPLVFFMFGYKSLKYSLGEVLSDPDS